MRYSTVERDWFDELKAIFCTCIVCVIIINVLGVQG